MKTSTIARIDGQPVLHRNKELEAELRPLTADELAKLKASIERDGILDTVKYWRNPSGVCEIVDGYNRDKIATELKISYNVQEIVFESGSITAVKYWMHKTQGGRRGGGANTVRMTELLTLLKAEQGTKTTRTQIIKEVAKDSETLERTVWKREAKVKAQPKTTGLDKVKRQLSAWPKSDLVTLRDWIVETLVNA